MGPSLNAEIYTNQLGWAHPLIAPQNQNGVTSNCGKKWLTYAPMVEKKSRPENSSSRIPTVPLLPFPRPPCSDFLWSGWLNPLNTWSWPTYLVYNLWSWRRDSLAPLATIRAMSWPFLFFLSQRWGILLWECVKGTKVALLRWSVRPAAISCPCAQANCDTLKLWCVTLVLSFPPHLQDEQVPSW